MNLTSILFQGMVNAFGATWLAALILFFAAFMIFIIMFNDIIAAAIFTLMSMTVFIMAGVFVGAALGYIIIGSALIIALIIARLFIR